MNDIPKRITKTPRRFARSPVAPAAKAADAELHVISPSPVAIPSAPTKAAIVLGLLRGETGATLAELVAATGWLPHTARAHLTGLRKKGHVLDKAKRCDVTCYSIGGAR